MLIIVLGCLVGFAPNVYASDETTCLSRVDVLSNNVGVTNTLPVLYINTANSQPILSKTEYVLATYWLDTKGHVEFESLGTAQTPLKMQIRGRGHSSWKSAKKPYKIKLDSKQAMLGMPKSKHWVLLKPLEGNIAGMALGKLLDMDWTPNFQPVEVVLNNDYLGLYMLGENIRVAKDRVDIYQQTDYETDPDLITGGWLVEIDNYVESNQITLKENDKWFLNVTYHSPENLSTAQKNWLTQEFKSINSAVYNQFKLSTEWEDFIDLEGMAKYFIIQEILDNPDGFHGSFYLHKDLGEGEKWKAGPLWDMLCYYRQKTDYTFRMKVHYNFVPHWIGEIIQYESFCSEVAKIWNEIYPDKLNEIYDIVEKTIKPMSMAWKNDNVRWDLDKSLTASVRIEKIQNALRSNIEWFNEHLPTSKYTAIEKVFEEPYYSEDNDSVFNPIDISEKFSGEQIKVYNLQGILIGSYNSVQGAISSLPKGLYIINGEKCLVR